MQLDSKAVPHCQVWIASYATSSLGQVHSIVQLHLVLTFASSTIVSTRPGYKRRKDVGWKHSVPPSWCSQSIIPTLAILNLTASSAVSRKSYVVISQHDTLETYNNGLWRLERLWYYHSMISTTLTASGTPLWSGLPCQKRLAMPSTYPTASVSHWSEPRFHMRLP